MIKKIKGSLFAKIFAITFLLTSICCVLTYTVISWLVPKTYSTTLDASLENTVSSFIAELQTMSPLESGTLFDEFLLNNNGVLLQLSDDDGNAIELPSQGAKEFPRFLDGGIATENTDPAAYRATHSYLFSFAGSGTVYTLTVAGSAHEVDLLRNTLANVFIIEASNPVPTPLLGHRCRSSQEITGSPTPFSTSNHYLWIWLSASFSLSNPNIAA